jgi:flagellar basal-body rod protein FlgG
MNRAMFAAATGMAAQQANLETIADNLANAELPGFKASSETFAALTDGKNGLGTVATGKRLIFEQGQLAKAGGPFDVALDGQGFFTLARPDGSLVYTRNGEFHRSADGAVRNADGYALAGVKIPSGALTVNVEPDGKTYVDTAAAKHQFAGRIRPAIFMSPESLRVAGSNLFEATSASGHPSYVNAGGDGAPKVAFGMLERSNVSVIEAMMEILSAQRAYEANSKGVQAADEMLRVADNIERS